MKKSVIFTFILVIAALFLTTCSTPSQSPTTQTQPVSVPAEPSDYRLRIELTCTTDWANLQIVNHEHVLSMSKVSVSGNPNKQDTDKGGIGLGQSLDSAEAGGEVGIIVDYVISLEARDDELAFQLQKGDINGCLMQIFFLVGDDYKLVHEENHQGIVGTDGLNTLEFVLDLSSMADIAAAGPSSTTSSDYYIRVELTCTTDWANLQIKNAHHTRSGNLVSVSGNASNPFVGIGGISVGQALSSAEGGKHVGITADYVFGEASDGALVFRLQKGDLKGCNVRVYHLVDGDYQLVHEVDHYAVSDTDTLNTLDFTFDLNTMAEIPISSTHCSRYENLELKVVLLTIGPDDTTMTMYVKFPDEVIGMQGGGTPLVYDAFLRDSPSIDCVVFEGEQYFGRLYCIHKLESGMKNSNQPWSLFVSGCPGAVFEVPLLSLHVTKLDTEQVDEDNACGPEPEPSCDDGGAYEDWCRCRGGYFGCLLGGERYPWCAFPGMTVCDIPWPPDHPLPPPQCP